MQSNLIISIPHEGVDANISVQRQDGTTDQKTVSIRDIINNLASSHKFSTGLLPKGTRFFLGSTVDYFIGIGTDARKRIFRYGDTENNIPFPYCFFAFIIKNKHIYKTYMYTSVRSLELETDRLYHFPYGNVYSHGEVCWGCVNLPEIRKPMDLVGVVNTFFSSNFNGDLFENYSFRHPEKYEDGELRIDSLYKMIEYVKNKDVFPTEMLNESDITLKNLIERGGNNE